MASQDNFVFSFLQYIQFKAVEQGYSYFPRVINVLFDEAYYLRQNSDVLAAVNSGAISSGAQHFFANGILEKRSPSAFFDEDLYLLANPDVKVAIDAGAIKNGLQHYTQFGFAEGRDALALTTKASGIKFSALFDESFYLRQNKDVASAVNNGAFSYGFEHFLRFGILEGRSPSNYYNEAFYLAKNSDVDAAVKAGRFQHGFAHYLQFGHLENRQASILFDPKFYGENNSDLADAYRKNVFSSYFEHYLEFGAQEGRIATQFYEEKYYLDQNPDVKAAVTNRVFQTGYEHFLRFGLQEGRSPSAFYDEQNYLLANPDIQRAVDSGIWASGLEHYLNIGLIEGRSLVPVFNPPPNSSGLNYANSAKALIADLSKNAVSFLNYSPNFKLMPVGDSITEGYDASSNVSRDPTYRGRHEGYRLDLQQKLQGLGLPVDFVGSLQHGPSEMVDRDHEGHAGRGIGFFLESANGFGDRIDDFINRSRPDMILLMIGTNDGGSSSGTDPNAVVNNMVFNMEKLLDTILDNSLFKGHVLVGTIAPAHPNGQWAFRGERFTAFNDRLDDVVASRNSNRLRFVEVGSRLDAIADMASPSVDNGLHPNQQGYAKMATAWFEALEKIVVDRKETIGNVKNIVGSAFDDVLIGNSQANVLEGGPGDDLLTGNGGADQFVYRLATHGFDRITDFSSDDQILVYDSGFNGNDLAAGFNFIGSSNPIASNNLPTFLYDTDDGILRYDPDGNNSQTAISLLKLDNAPALAKSQIVVV